MGARFFVDGYRDLLPTNDASHTAQWKSIMAILSVISYMLRNFRAVGVARSILKSRHLASRNFTKTPFGAEKNLHTMWEIGTPLCGSATACKEWYLTVRD